MRTLPVLSFVFVIVFNGPELVIRIESSLHLRDVGLELRADAKLPAYTPKLGGEVGDLGILFFSAALFLAKLVPSVGKLNLPLKQAIFVSDKLNLVVDFVLNDKIVQPLVPIELFDLLAVDAVGDLLSLADEPQRIHPPVHERHKAVLLLIWHEGLFHLR